MAAYLLAWMVFTGVMFFGIPRSDRALQLVFGSLTMLFFLLGLSHLVALDDEDKGETVEKIAGWVGIVCGLSAIYAGEYSVCCCCCVVFLIVCSPLCFAPLWFSFAGPCCAVLLLIVLPLFVFPFSGFANLNGWPKTWEKPDKNEALLAAENKKDMEMVATH